MTVSYMPVDLNPAATEDRNRQNEPADPFSDDLFAPVDMRQEPLGNHLAEIANQNPELAPPPPPDLPGQGEEEEPAPPPASHEPEVITYDDGSVITIGKSNRGWKATLDSGTGNPEIFYGKTKDEMWTNLAAAKMHATRHIRDLNKKIKLTARPEPVAQPPQRPTAAAHEAHVLTADEIVEIKNQLGVNPALALDNLFQKQTGLTVAELASLARQGYNEGRASRAELDMESVAKEFCGAHPDYVTHDDNYFTLVGWLAKYRLGRTLTSRNQNELMNLLYQNGFWTVDNLDEAFEELAQDGFIELASNEPEQEEEEEQPAPPPPTPNPRIARVRVGPRAGLGIRTRETTAAREPAVNRPPSAEELDRLSDDDIQNLFSGVRRYASQSARR